MVIVTVFMCRIPKRSEPTGTKSRPCRSQRTHTSVDAGQCRSSKGVQGDGCEMTRHSELRPGVVSESADRPRTRPDGDVRARWTWTEQSVWTDRMLTALESGVYRCWVVFSGRSPSSCLSILEEVKPSTGEPDAGDPHVRFGGGRDRNQSVLPTPICFVHR